MGKRTRNKPDEVAVVEKTREEQLAEIDRDYRGIKRMMTIGLVGVVLLIILLALRQPGGWVVAALILGAIEGISYPILLKSLNRRRADRIASLDSGE
jgi:hypothetical protein